MSKRAFTIRNCSAYATARRTRSVCSVANRGNNVRLTFTAAAYTTDTGYRGLDGETTRSNGVRAVRYRRAQWRLTVYASVGPYEQDEKF